MMSTGLARGQVAGSTASSAADRLRRELGEPAAEIDQRVGRQDADAAAVGHDREPVAARRLRRGQGLDGVEQLLEPEHAQHAGAPEGGVVDRIGAGQRAGVRGGGARALGMPARLDHDHRLHARRGPRRGHELARVGDHLDVEQDRPGRGVVGQVVEHVAEVDVGHVAERDQVREADAARRSPSRARRSPSRPTARRRRVARAAAATCAKLAFRPMPGTMMPRQLGPTMRSRCGLPASSIAWLQLGAARLARLPRSRR